MKFRMLRLFWRVLRLLRAWRTLSRLHCQGDAPAGCWFPPGVNGSEKGYYRSGILRQYCELWNNHEGPCRAAINHLGDRVGSGSPFEPERPRWVEAVEVFTPTQLSSLEEELRDRFEDAEKNWTQVQGSPHYPTIMSYAAKGSWSMVSMLLQEIWEGTDR
jgi:hypothetical protein